MPDREKVIVALENCADFVKCRDCPWDECDGIEHDVVNGVPRNLMLDALKLFKEQTTSGWISVKDRMPEHGKRYLIYATSGDNKIGHITTAAFGGHFALSGRCAYWKITHWMPLPEPPKEENHETD